MATLKDSTESLSTAFLRYATPASAVYNGARENGTFLCQVLHNGTWYYGECMFLEFPRGGESLSLLLTATLLWDIIYIIKGVHLCVDPQAVPFQML